MSIAQMMQVLWDAAIPHLTDEQLEKLDCSNSVNAQLTNIAEVMSAIGCLVSSDGREGTVGAGNFQSSHDVPTLLFTFASAIEAAAGAMFISDEARFILHDQRGQAAKAALDIKRQKPSLSHASTE